MAGKRQMLTVSSIVRYHTNLTVEAIERRVEAGGDVPSSFHHLGVERFDHRLLRGYRPRPIILRNKNPHRKNRWVGGGGGGGGSGTSKMRTWTMVLNVDVTPTSTLKKGANNEFKGIHRQTRGTDNTENLDEASTQITG